MSTALCNKCDFDEELKDESGKVLSLVEAKQLIKSKRETENIKEITERESKQNEKRSKQLVRNRIVCWPYRLKT